MSMSAHTLLLSAESLISSSPADARNILVLQYLNMMLFCHPHKAVAAAAFLFLLLYSLISLVELSDTPDGVNETNEVVSQGQATIKVDPQTKAKQRRREMKLRRGAETLNTLAETEDIWLRRSPMQHAALREEVS